MRQAIFVDLSNLYRRLSRELGLPTDQTRKYFTSWFDFSILSLYLTKTCGSVWIFYAEGKLIAHNHRLEQAELFSLIERFNRQKGVSAHDVNIPGDQREPYTVMCPKCNVSVDAEFKSEKGIDSSLIVHLFDTAPSWDVAYILSGDADFLPAVRSLRRSGKIVNGAGFLSSASRALVRECFEYADLRSFVENDYAAFRLLGPGGLLADRGIENYLHDTQSQSIARVILEVSAAEGSDDCQLLIESNVINFEKLRNDILPLAVDPQGLSSDKHWITFRRCLFDPIHEAILYLLRGYGTWSGGPRTEEGGKYAARYYLEFQWNVDQLKYLHRADVT